MIRTPPRFVGRPTLPPGAGALGLLLAVAVLAAASGCERRRDRESTPVPLPIEVFADSGATRRLRVEPPVARAWLARVTPARRAAPGPALPDAAPDTLLPEAPPPPLEIDSGLKPPILKRAGTLILPEHARGPRAGVAVELEVHVNESGSVSAAEWAGGSRDTAWVGAARRCALEMRFFPALRAGRPVAVWCRQRFDFSRRR